MLEYILTTQFSRLLVKGHAWTKEREILKHDPNELLNISATEAARRIRNGEVRIKPPGKTPHLADIS